MAYPDHVTYYSLLLLEAAAHNRYTDYREVDTLQRQSNVDAEHVAWYLATMLAPIIRMRPGWASHIERDIAAAKLIAESELGSEHDNAMFASNTRPSPTQGTHPCP